MPAADMFIHSILELWGMSENLPFIYVPWGQQWFDWCFAQALNERAERSLPQWPRYCDLLLRVKRIHVCMSVRPDYFRTAQCTGNAK